MQTTQKNKKNTTCYPTALRTCRVQVASQNKYKYSLYIWTENRLDRFSCNTQVTNWIEVIKKIIWRVGDFKSLIRCFVV